MDYKDYYKILGVPRTATAKEIKAAYRKLARKHHPDVNAGDTGAEARFKELNEAHTVLGDPEKRRRYDELGADWSRFRDAPPGARGGAWPGGRVRVNVQGFDEAGFGGFSDFFRTFFAGGFPGGVGGFEDDALVGDDRGDLEAEVDLSLEEVARGTTRKVALEREGKRREVEVKIPAGVADGSRVRAGGEGQARRRGGHGDLYLRVRTRPHPRFERQGDDLRTTVRAPLTTAILGGDLDVPTLDGTRGIKVPPGTPSGRTFRLRGLGVPRLGGGGARGDLLAVLEVEVPRDLTPQEKKLFEELRALGR